MWTPVQRAEALAIATERVSPEEAHALVLRLEARYPEPDSLCALVNTAAWRLRIDRRRKEAHQERMRRLVAARHRKVAQELTLKEALMTDLRQALGRVEAEAKGRSVLGARIFVVLASGQMVWDDVFAQYPDTRTNTVSQWASRGGRLLFARCSTSTQDFLRQHRKVEPILVSFLGIPEPTVDANATYLTRYQRAQQEYRWHLGRERQRAPRQNRNSDF